MRALVTGAAGFAGSHLLDHLLESGDEVIALVHPEESLRNLVHCETGILIERGNVLDESWCAVICEKHRPDVCFHLAGVSFVPMGVEHPNRMIEVNCTGALNMLEAVRRKSPKAKFIFAGSAEVYGPLQEKDLPATEQTPLNPATLYAHSKYFAEKLVLWYGTQYGMDNIVLRLFNHIGPRQGTQFAVSSFADQIRKIRDGSMPPVLRVGNLEARRDFTDVRDVARAYRMCATAAPERRVFNICSGADIGIREILDLLIEISGVKVQIELDPTRLRASDTPRYLGSNRLAREKLGWLPQIGIERTLRDLLN
jgi:GDP-4-dehydro-6-deoxy-D-mannose reductase